MSFYTTTLHVTKLLYIGIRIDESLSRHVHDWFYIENYHYLSHDKVPQSSAVMYAIAFNHKNNINNVNFV